MIRFIYYILLIFIFSSNLFCQTKYIRLINLPWDATEVLNKEFVRWDYFNSPIPYFDSTGGPSKAWEYADLIKGDFNDDSKEDYAALIKPYNTNNGFLVVLLKNDSSYDLVKLQEVGFHKDNVLFLDEKGNEMYDFETEDTFLLPDDGICLGVYEITGVTYYMKNGKFTVFVSSD